MNSTFAVVRRELAEKRFVFVAALAFALLSVILALTVHMRSSFTEAMTLCSAIFGAGFAGGLAVILGATIVGRELAENRLSFYFSRPLPAPAIWFGKFFASAILITGSFLIVFAPALSTGSRLATQWTSSAAAFGSFVVLAALILFLAAHVLSTMVRSRSAWIAIDFLCVVATGAAVLAMLSLPLAARAFTVTKVASAALGGGFLIVVLGACTWQLAKGRTDRLGNHLALSRFLWTGVTLVLLFVAASLLWAMSVTPADLVDIQGGSVRAGWAVFRGHAAGRGDYEPTFLVNADGRTMRILTPPWWGGVHVARNGKVAVWLRMRTSLLHPVPLELVLCQLDVPQPHAERTGVTMGPQEMELSDDGSRLVTGGETVNVYDLAAKRSLGSFHLGTPEMSWPQVMFVTNDVVRVYVRSRAGDEAIYEYDVRARALRPTGTFQGWAQSFSADRTRMVVYKNHHPYLADARSGEPITNLAGKMVRFLADGSIASVETHDLHATVRHFDANGRLLREAVLSPHTEAIIGGGDGHRVVLGLRRNGTADWGVAVFDLDRGVITREEPSLRIALLDPDQSLPNEILATTEHGVVTWNLTTGAKRLVAGH